MYVFLHYKQKYRLIRFFFSEFYNGPPGLDLRGEINSFTERNYFLIGWIPFFHTSVLRLPFSNGIIGTNKLEIMKDKFPTYGSGKSCAAPQEDKNYYIIYTYIHADVKILAYILM